MSLSALSNPCPSGIKAQAWDTVVKLFQSDKLRLLDHLNPGEPKNHITPSDFLYQAGALSRVDYKKFRFDHPSRHQKDILDAGAAYGPKIGYENRAETTLANRSGRLYWARSATQQGKVLIGVTLGPAAARQMAADSNKATLTGLAQMRQILDKTEQAAVNTDMYIESAAADDASPVTCFVCGKAPLGLMLCDQCKGVGVCKGCNGESIPDGFQGNIYCADPVCRRRYNAGFGDILMSHPDGSVSEDSDSDESDSEGAISANIRAVAVSGRANRLKARKSSAKLARKSIGKRKLSRSGRIVKDGGLTAKFRSKLVKRNVDKQWNSSHDSYIQVFKCCGKIYARIVKPKEIEWGRVA